MGSIRKTPGIYRLYLIDGKTRLLSRLVNHTEDTAAIAVCLVQAGLGLVQAGLARLLIIDC
jgi:hypothetical protein